MVLTVLGTEVVGGKGSGALARTAETIADIVRRAKNPLEAAQALCPPGRCQRRGDRPAGEGPRRAAAPGAPGGGPESGRGGGGQEAACKVNKIPYEGGICEWLRKSHGITDDAKLNDMLNSTDFSKPVQLMELPEGTEIVQYVRENGRVGTFFAYPGTKPAELAISGEGRMLGQFVIDEPVSVVQSTAALFPTGKYPGVGGPGGGVQLIFPKDVIPSERLIK